MLSIFKYLFPLLKKRFLNSVRYTLYMDTQMCVVLFEYSSDIQIRPTVPIKVFTPLGDLPFLLLFYMRHDQQNLAFITKTEGYISNCINIQQLGRAVVA